MSTAIKPTSVDLIPIRYSIADARISELRAEFTGLAADTKEGYEAVRHAIATCRTSRGLLRKDHDALKEDSLIWGRRVDAEYKRLLGLIEVIESPLQEKKDAIDKEVERIRKAKADAARKVIEDAAIAKRAAEESERRKQREAEELKLKAEREALAAERKRLGELAAAAEAKLLVEHKAIMAQQEVERDRLAAEQLRAELANQAERKRQHSEQEKIDAERRAVDAERQRLQLVESKRLEKLRQAQEDRERVDRERVERESLQEEAVKAVEREAARVEAMRPDVEKIRAFGETLRTLQFDSLKSRKALDFAKQMESQIEELAECCEAFEA